MKKIICFLTIISLLAGLGVNAFAAEITEPRTIEIYLNEPRLGMDISSAFAYTTDDDIEVYTSWYTGADPWAEEAELLEAGQFTAGTYSVWIEILGGLPMSMSNVTSITVNGKAPDSWSSYDDLYNTFWVKYSFTLEGSAEPISLVELTMEQPQVGKSFDECLLSAPQDANYTVSSYWFDTTDNICPDGTFQEGHSYMIFMGVFAKEGYYLSESTRVLVNGEDTFFYYFELFSMYIDGSCEFTLGSMTPGDFNDDGEITDGDAIYLLRNTLFGELKYPLNYSGDVNNDGRITDADAVYLLRNTLYGEAFYPLYPSK